MQSECIAKLFSTNDVTQLHWEPFREGIEIARIATSDDGPSAAFVRYAPGARLARHQHVGWEYILILSGAQVDESGVHSAGELLVHPPQTWHKVSSEHGCTVLAIWEKPVVFEKE